MQTQFQTTDYYAILGVSLNATRDDIKHAYARKVREHPPEKDPEGYKIVRRAYDTLIDESARREYDNLRRFGPEIQHLTDEALMFMMVRNFNEAIPKLKRVLVLNPDAHEARSLLGQCLMETQKYDDAIKEFQTLIQKSPRTPRYHLDLGYACLRKYEVQSEWLKDRTLLDRARLAFAKARELDPISNASYIGTAISFQDEGNFSQALDWLEKAISADQKVDFMDFDAIFQKCIVLALANRSGEIEREAKRIEELAPPEKEARQYVAFMFAVTGFELLKLQAYAPAHYFLKAAIRFDPENPDLSNLQRVAEMLHNANEDWKRFQHDTSIIQPLKAMAGVGFLDFAGLGNEYEKEQVFRNALSALRYYSPSKIRENVERIKSSYPGIYKIGQQFWDRLLEACRNASSYSYGSTYGAGSGCVLAIIGAIVGTFILPGIGTLIGLWLGSWLGGGMGS